MQYNVSTAKVIVATFFAFCCAGKVCIDSFLTVFLRHMGLTPFQAGVFRSLQALVGGASVVGISYCAGMFQKRLGSAVFILVAVLCNVLLLVSSLHFPCFYVPHPSCSSRSMVAKPLHKTSSHLLKENGSMATNEHMKFVNNDVKPFVSNIEGAMTEKYQVIKKHHPASTGKVSYKQLDSTFSTKMADLHETVPHIHSSFVGIKSNFSTASTIMAAHPKAEDSIMLPKEISRTTRSTGKTFGNITGNIQRTSNTVLKFKQSDMEMNATKPLHDMTPRTFNTDKHKKLSSSLHSVLEGREVNKPVQSTEKNSDNSITRTEIQTPPSMVGMIKYNLNSRHDANDVLPVPNSSHDTKETLAERLQERSYNYHSENTLKMDKLLGILPDSHKHAIPRKMYPNVPREAYDGKAHAIHQPGYRYPQDWRVINSQGYDGSPTRPWYQNYRQNLVLRKRSYTIKPGSNISNPYRYLRNAKIQPQILTTGSLLWPSFSVFCILSVLGLILLGELSSSPIDKVADESWYQYLDEIDYIERYDQRMSGVSVTTTATLLLIGLIVKFYCTSDLLILPAYHLHFYMFALFWALMFFLKYFYPRPMGSSGQSNNLFKGLAFIRYMGHDGASSLVLITVFVCGALHGCINDFILWYMEDLGGDEFITTSAVAIAMASEILPQIFSKYFFRRTSLSCMLSISVFTYSVRFALIAFMWTPWSIAITQVLHCLSNYFFWIGIQSYVTRLCFQGTGRSVLLVMHLIHHQLGRALGSCFGGLVYSLGKPKTLFFAMSGIALLWGLLFTVFQYCSVSSRKGRLSESISKEYGDGDELQFSRLLGDEEEEGEDWLELAMKDEKPKKRKQSR